MIFTQDILGEVTFGVDGRGVAEPAEVVSGHHTGVSPPHHPPSLEMIQMRLMERSRQGRRQVW